MKRLSLFMATTALGAALVASGPQLAFGQSPGAPMGGGGSFGGGGGRFGGNDAFIGLARSACSGFQRTNRRNRSHCRHRDVQGYRYQGPTSSLG